MPSLRPTPRVSESRRDIVYAYIMCRNTVKKKHAEMVPQKLKEEEFWTQFFQSQFFHHESKSQQFVDCLSGEQQKGI